ncbi:15351_t:CDS:2 [Funneliformis geosporum]|nr:15351_t:CDS:2 [Funneliformis geosporum]
MQYANRIISVIGASTYLVGEANENSTYKKIGGTVAVASLYIEFLASYGKEKLFKTGERQKKDTETLGNNYLKLAEILKPIRTPKSLGKLKEVINSLKKTINEVIEKDDDERRTIKREEVKKLMEILQEAVSEYQQGVSEKEIEDKIESKLDDMLLESIYKQGSRKKPAPLFHDEQSEKEIYDLVSQLKFKGHYYASLRANCVFANCECQHYYQTVAPATSSFLAEKRIAKKRLARELEGVNDLFANAIATIQKL